MQTRCEHTKPASNTVLRQMTHLRSSSFEINIKYSFPVILDKQILSCSPDKTFECTSVSTSFYDLPISSSNVEKIHLNNFRMLKSLRDYRFIRFVRDYSMLRN
jgi:hypothetical protein